MSSEKLKKDHFFSGANELYKRGELKLRIDNAVQKIVEEHKRSGAKDTDPFSIVLLIGEQGNVMCHIKDNASSYFDNIQSH